MNEHLYILEKVKFNTEIIKVLALLELAAISGVITLFYQWTEYTGKNFILSFFGLIAIFVLIRMIYVFYSDSRKLINKLK